MPAINRFSPNYGESVNLVRTSIFSKRAMQKVTSVESEGITLPYFVVVSRNSSINHRTVPDG